MTEYLLQVSWLVPFYGLIGAVLTIPWSSGIIRRTGSRPAAYINLLVTLFAFIHGSIAFGEIWNVEPLNLSFHWLQAADLDLTIAIEISPVTLGAMELVTGITLLAQVYALGYMEKDWSLARFFGLMGFFEAAMAGIAISDSLFLTYCLLELLTLSTYLLVGFWYAQPLVVSAARDAFLTKRVGDIILLMGIVGLSSYGEGLTFSQLESWVETSPIPLFTATVLGLSLIAGPTGKCAQFPLNLWLDEAMEGPNPAGILRNSIVVSMGAYVLIKLQPIFILSPIASDVLIVIGTVTALGTSLMSLAQLDIKRVLSHSTSAYFGLVFIAIGLEQVDIALLLLFTHAVAKALLFMSAGSVILTTNDQNITEMGGLWSKMPATALSYLVGAAGLVSLFPLGMFWTMQRWFNGDWQVNWWLLAVLLWVNVLSAVSLTRAFRLIFLGEPQMKTRRAPEAPWLMALPMVGLAVVTFIVPFVPQGWLFWLSPVDPLSNQDLPVVQWAVPLIVASGILGCLIGSQIKLARAWSRPMKMYLRFIQDLFAYDFYVERLYEFTVVLAIRTISQLAAWLDRYIVDGAVNLVGLVTMLGGNALKYNASGQSQFYLLTILVGVSLLLWSVVNGHWSSMVTYWSSLTSY